MATPANSTVHADREVDARGLNCPLPILRTKKMLNDMKSGEIVHIATDPASVRDFQAFARQTGNELVEHGERDGAFFFYLRDMTKDARKANASFVIRRATATSWKRAEHKRAARAVR